MSQDLHRERELENAHQMGILQAQVAAIMTRLNWLYGLVAAVFGLIAAYVVGKI